MNQFTLSFLVRQLGIRTSLFQTLHTLFGDLIVQYVPCSETTTIDSHGCVVWTYTFCVQDVDLPSGVSSVCAITPDILEIPYMTAIAPLYFEDSETVDVQGNGSSVLPYSFHAILDPDSDNIIVANANGLYAEESAAVAALTLNVEDEGGVVSTVVVNTINFIGDGVTATESAPGEINVTIPGAAIAANSVLQKIVRQYNPSAKQNLTGAFVDVAGSDYSFTPSVIGSTILYSYSFQHSADAYNNMSSAFKLQVDGIDQSESELTVSHDYTDISPQKLETYVMSVSSWGLTAKTIKLLGRDYSPSNSQLHGSMDGTLLFRGTLEITEIAP